MEGTRFFHFRNMLWPAQAVTIAVQRTNANANGSTVQVGFAWCSVDDAFCRRTGRQIAEGRMNLLHPHSRVMSDVQFHAAMGELRLVRMRGESIFPRDVYKLFGMRWTEYAGREDDIEY